MTLLQRRIRKAVKIIEKADETIEADSISSKLRHPHLSSKELEFCLKTLYEIGGHFTKK